MAVPMHGEMIEENLRTNPAIFLHTCLYFMLSPSRNTIEIEENLGTNPAILPNKCLFFMTIIEK